MFRFFEYAKLMFFLDMHKFHAKYLIPTHTALWFKLAWALAEGQSGRVRGFV